MSKLQSIVKDITEDIRTKPDRGEVASSIPELARQGVLQRNVASLDELDAVFEESSSADLVFLDISSVVANPEWPAANVLRRWLMERGATLHLAINAIARLSQWSSDIVLFRWFEPAYLLLSHTEQVTDWITLAQSIESTGLECSYFSAGSEMDSPIDLANPNTLIPASRAASAN